MYSMLQVTNVKVMMIQMISMLFRDVEKDE